MQRRDGGGFDAQEYIEHPELYISTFSKKIAPYASVIVNGIYWAVGSPKLLTNRDAKILLRPANTPLLPYSLGAPSLPHRILAICDISADPGGSIEFMNECTSIGTPFRLYDADRNKNTNSFEGPGVLVCSIGIPHSLEYKHQLNKFHDFTNHFEDIFIELKPIHINDKTV